MFNNLRLALASSFSIFLVTYKCALEWSIFYEHFNRAHPKTCWQMDVWTTMSEKLCLKWNDFQENANSTFRYLRKSSLITPLLERRKCWGKTILPRAGYRLGTYSTVDIFNFSHFWCAILEKRRFLCFYIIKSIARKGYFGPKYP